MTNAERRELLELTKQAQTQGFQGSVLDVFQNPAALQEFSAQQQQKMQAQPRNVEVAATPEQQQQGLRGRTPQDAPGAMVFPNVAANTPFNTVGMKFPINIEKRDEMGHLVESHQNVPPGLVNIGTGPKKGTIIETPARKQYGGPKTGAPRVPTMSDTEMSLKIIQEANAGNPAARRMRTHYGQEMYLDGSDIPSTHYMASMGEYAVPLVQEDYIGGPLTYSENPPPSSSDFKFDTSEEAAYFAENYKNAAAAKAFNKKRAGGYRHLPRY